MVEDIENNNYSGNNFIDENHVDLLEHLKLLDVSDSVNWSSEVFHNTLRSFILNLENHFMLNGTADP